MNQIKYLPKGVKNLTGEVFGKLTVIGFSHIQTNPKNTCAMWYCKCECGTQKIMRNLPRKKSCGCLVSIGTHYMSKTKTYKIWQGMLKRCNNSNATNFKDYGGRGINVCERWHTFENFFADMGECPLNKTLDRIDNNAGYSPDNCKWSTWSEQAFNKRKRQNCSSQFKGVSFDRKSSLWVSRIQLNGKKIFRKSFKTEFEAYQARQAFLAIQDAI